MAFYRKATIDDIAEKDDCYAKHMSVEVMELIREGKLLEASKRYREFHNCGIEQAKTWVRGYESFLKVVKDYKAGKDIYTDY